MDFNDLTPEQQARARECEALDDGSPSREASSSTLPEKIKKIRILSIRNVLSEMRP